MSDVLQSFIEGLPRFLTQADGNWAEKIAGKYIIPILEKLPFVAHAADENSLSFN
jgi:hypothetical protein